MAKNWQDALPITQPAVSERWRVQLYTVSGKKKNQ